MFGHSYQTNNEVLYDPKYRLFNFSCTLIPEVEVDYQLMKNIQLYNKNECNMDLSLKYNDQNLSLNDEKTMDFTIIIPEIDKNESEYKLLTSLRENCNITKGIIYFFIINN